MEYYVCPMCEEKNEDHVKYCKTCGTWLQNETFPAKKLKKRKKGSKAFKVISIVFGILVGLPIVLAAIGAFTGEHNVNTGGAINQSNNANQNTKQQVGNPGQSRSSPASIGVSVSGTLSQWGMLSVSDKEKFDVTLRVEDVIRGEDAMSTVKSSNPYNPDPESGHEYLLAKIYIGINKAHSPDAQLTISPLQFAAVSANGKVYDPKILVLKDGVSAQLYSGAEHSGWAVFQIAQGDDPVIAVARDTQGRGGLWFSTK